MRPHAPNGGEPGGSGAHARWSRWEDGERVGSAGGMEDAGIHGIPRIVAVDGAARPARCRRIFGASVPGNLSHFPPLSVSMRRTGGGASEDVAVETGPLLRTWRHHPYEYWLKQFNEWVIFFFWVAVVYFSNYEQVVMKKEVILHICENTNILYLLTNVETTFTAGKR